MSNVIDHHSAISLMNEYLKRVGDRRKDLERSVLSGNLENVEAYKERVGAIKQLVWVEQEFREVVADRLKQQVENE